MPIKCRSCSLEVKTARYFVDGLCYFCHLLEQGDIKGNFLPIITSKSQREVIDYGLGLAIYAEMSEKHSEAVDRLLLFIEKKLTIKPLIDLIAQRSNGIIEQQGETVSNSDLYSLLQWQEHEEAKTLKYNIKFLPIKTYKNKHIVEKLVKELAE